MAAIIDVATFPVEPVRSVVAEADRRVFALNLICFIFITSAALRSQTVRSHARDQSRDIDSKGLATTC